MKVWKDFRTNFMYWRFRNITRNRLRLKAWWARNRPSSRPSFPQASRYQAAHYRERGTAARPLYTSSSRRRSWIAFILMIVLLTAIDTATTYWAINGAVVNAARILVIIGAVYWAMRGV